MTTDFHGLHAIITGGSSGIGKATACRLAQAGAQVTLIARDPLKLQAAQAEVEAHRESAQQRVLALSADVSQCAEVDRAVAVATRVNGPADILIASAGVVQPGYFDQLPLAAFERTMAIDYFGALHAVRSVLPGMRQKGHGHIVMISSGAGLIGVFGYTSYSPAKFAVRGLAEALRAELKADNIRLSVVYPPDTDTPQLHEENKTKPVETRIIAGQGGLWTADAVAGAIFAGIRRDAFRITPGIQMTLLAWLNSLVEPALARYIDSVVARARRQARQRARQNGQRVNADDGAGR